MDNFIYQWKLLADLVHRNAVTKGFWPEDKSQANDAERLCLIHAEVSEALEGLRKGNPQSEHIPEFTAAEEELADVIIRIMDYAAGREWRVAEAVLAKYRYNLSRPYKHGKKF